MDDFDKVLPKLINIELFSDFSADNQRDREILKKVYDSMNLQSYKKGDVRCI